MREKNLLLVVVILLTSAFSLAQSPQSVTPVSVLVNVIDRHGEAVRNLTKDNFRVQVNGRPASLLEASYSLAPRRLAVLLDMSGSMGGQAGDERWQIAREAFEDLLTDTPADVPVALLTSSDQVHDVFDFSQS